MGYGPSRCPAVPTLALPSSYPSRVNPCLCPNPAGLLQLGVASGYLSPGSSPLPCLSRHELLTYPPDPACPVGLQKTDFIPKHQPNSLSFGTFYFSLSRAHLGQHPAFDSSLQGTLKEKHGKLSKEVVLPQHILPAAPDFPVTEKNLVSAQIYNGVGGPALQIALSQTLHLRKPPQQGRPPVPSPI